VTTDHRSPRLIGHRGAPRDCPENTIPSFLRALELGADGVVLDVHRTRDGVIVVHHDETVRDDGPRIDALGHDALRAIMPTLAEVLAALDGRADVFVELKGRGVERETIDVIRRSPAPSRCAVHSFDHESVRRARALAPELRGGILFDRPVADVAAAMRAADALDVWPHDPLVDAALVRAVREAGGRVIAWTVNEPARAAALAALGVDGLCTDTLPGIREALPA
jgi:glycerophosphoryl diester phosphodiesterase